MPRGTLKATFIHLSLLFLSSFSTTICADLEKVSVDLRPDNGGKMDFRKYLNPIEYRQSLALLLPPQYQQPQPQPQPPQFPHRKSRKGGAVRQFLDGHNNLRKSLNQTPFVWDRKLARFARRWANKRKADCGIQHTGGNYGENIFAGEGPWSVAEAVRAWAMEQSSYNASDNTCLPNAMCGHYTQMVWSRTVRVGCARVECDTPWTGTFIMCSYDPPGNFEGESPFH